MTKSELIEVIATKHPHLNVKDVEQVVNCIIEQMNQTLASGERIEIRNFASFSLRYRPPRMSRNPQTGEAIALTSRYAPHFKPGQELRERVQNKIVGTEKQ